MSIIRVFKCGDIFAICKDTSAQAPDGLDTCELVLNLLKAKGTDEGDAVHRKALAYSIINVMQQQFRRGRVSDARKRHGVRVWIKVGHAYDFVLINGPPLVIFWPKENQNVSLARAAACAGTFCAG